MTGIVNTTGARSGVIGTIVGSVETLDLATATFPAGMVIQTSVLTPYALSSNVYSSTEGTPQSTVGSSGELSMVTKGTNSKFIIQYNGNAAHTAPTGNRGVVTFIHFCNGAWSSVGANVTASTAQGSGTYFHNGSDWQDVVGSITAVHTPSYTKGDTLRWREYYWAHSSNSGSAYWNHTGGIQSDTNSSDAYYQGWVMEVAQ